MMLLQYPSVFYGNSCIQDGVYHITLNPVVKPVQHARCVEVFLREKLKDVHEDLVK